MKPFPRLREDLPAFLAAPPSAVAPAILSPTTLASATAILTLSRPRPAATSGEVLHEAPFGRAARVEAHTDRSHCWPRPLRTEPFADRRETPPPPARVVIRWIRPAIRGRRRALTPFVTTGAVPEAETPSPGSRGPFSHRQVTGPPPPFDGVAPAPVESHRNGPLREEGNHPWAPRVPPTSSPE